MIVKYLNDGVWGYIDNVRQVASMNIDTDELVTRFNAENKFDNPEDDVCSYLNGVKLSQDITVANKAFTMACNTISKKFDEAEYGQVHTTNLLDGTKILQNFPASAILLYLNDNKEYDTLLMVVNQPVYLMNDKGQTIERLV